MNGEEVRRLEHALAGPAYRGECPAMARARVARALAGRGYRSVGGLIRLGLRGAPASADLVAHLTQR